MLSTDKKAVIKLLSIENRVSINSIKNNETISIPRNWIREEDLGYKTLKVGQFKRKVLCLSNDTENCIELPYDILLEIGLSVNDINNVIFKGNEIRLGPVIATFVSNGTINRAKRQEPNFRTSELMKANYIANTILYFFSIKDVDFYNEKIHGMYFNKKNNKWEQKLFPLPDVLYDRGGGTLRKQRVISQYIRDQLEKLEGIVKYNPTYFLEKWDIYEKLKEYEELRKYLPNTAKYKDINQLKIFLSENKIVYLKDIKGNNGKNIIRIEEINPNIYSYQYMKDELKTGEIKGVKSLKNIINKYLGKRELIIQQSIDVLQIDNKNIDMRVLVERTGEGNTVITD